jgi:predicted acylesterase/phospholipase RssA
VSRALVLNAGASWAAYQVGALRHVVGERGLRFDLLAGTGIGAMNAAFVACGEFEALGEVWRRMSLRRLVRPTLRRWWLGPLSGDPQRAAIAPHISEERLAARGARLLVNTLDLRSGGQRVLEYPGADVPLLDGLMAAVATPGLIAPLDRDGAQLMEGTLVESFLLRDVLVRRPDKVVAIAVVSPRRAPHRRYDTWRAVSARALALNLDHDVRSALEHADRTAGVAAAQQRAAEGLLALVSDRVSDPRLAAELQDRIGTLYGGAAAPAMTTITPSRALGYPLWRFSQRELRAAAELGYADARTAFAARAAG